MRNKMEAVLKESFRELALKTRDKCNLTQKKMAEGLVMSETSYSDIETGTNMCGTLTAILLLIKQPNPEEFLRELLKKFEILYEKERLIA